MTDDVAGGEGNAGLRFQAVGHRLPGFQVAVVGHIAVHTLDRVLGQTA